MMKNTPTWLNQILLVTLITIGITGCRPNTKPHAQKFKKDIDKSVLLTIVDSLVHSVALKNKTIANGRNVLMRYQRDYKLVVNGNPKNLLDSDVTFVNISDQSYLLFVFGLSKTLQTQLTFKDLEKAFGPGILSPLPKEPVSFSMIYQLPGIDRVFINVTSAHLPNAIQNRILEIAVMR